MDDLELTQDEWYKQFIEQGNATQAEPQIEIDPIVQDLFYGVGVDLTETYNNPYRQMGNAVGDYLAHRIGDTQFGLAIQELKGLPDQIQKDRLYNAVSSARELNSLSETNIRTRVVDSLLEAIDGGAIDTFKLGDVIAQHQPKQYQSSKRTGLLRYLIRG